MDILYYGYTYINETKICYRGTNKFHFNKNELNYLTFESSRTLAIASKRYVTYSTQQNVLHE